MPSIAIFEGFGAEKKKGFDKTRTEPVLNPLFTRTNPLKIIENMGFCENPGFSKPVLNPY